MPLYEYMCESCGKEEEVLQKYHDPAPQVVVSSRVVPVLMRAPARNCLKELCALPPLPDIRLP